MYARQRSEFVTALPLSVVRHLIAAGCLFAAGNASAGVCSNQIDIAPAACSQASVPQSACEEILEREPDALSVRIALCDALVDAGDNEAAAAITEAGLEQHSNRRAISILQRALSNVSEISTQKRSGPQLETLVEYLLIRCTDLNNLTACNEAVQARPNDPRSYAARAKLQLAADKPTAAIMDYRKALEINADYPGAEAALVKAEVKRAAQAETCLASADSKSIELCEQVLLVGAEDEAAVAVRLGELTAERGEFKQALRYFRQAAGAPDTYVNSDDQSISPDILAETLSSGLACRDDPESVGYQTCTNVVSSLGDQPHLTALTGQIWFSLCEASSGDVRFDSRPACSAAQEYQLDSRQTANILAFERAERRVQQRAAAASAPVETVEEPGAPVVASFPEAEPETELAIATTVAVTDVAVTEVASDIIIDPDGDFELDGASSNAPQSSSDGVEVVTF